MAENWKDYQEEAAKFFRALGLTAETDVVLKGVRTDHAVDVLVSIDIAGFSVRWIVECKHWKEAVNKGHVFILRQIVTDIGADRGIILCEAGFQSGAIEAANLTNVRVSSLAEFESTSRDAIASARLPDLFDRVQACGLRYWEIPKSIRIKYGLRPDFFGNDLYSGQWVVEVAVKYLSAAFRSAYPIEVDPFDIEKLRRSLPSRFTRPGEVVEAFQPVIAELEGKLTSAEAATT